MMSRVNRTKEEIEFDINHGSKVCPVCKERKPFSSYNKDRSAPDGIVKVCKDCINIIRYSGRKKPTTGEYECNIRTETKVCSVCKRRLPFSSYHNSSKSKDGKGYRCLSCDEEARKRYINTNKERVQVLSRSKNIKSRFNLEEDRLREIMDNQKGCCVICNNSLIDPNKNSTKQYGIDHNHDTGEVRGLLCMHCNAMLGQAMDSPRILLAGYNYLMKHGFYGE